MRITLETYTLVKNTPVIKIRLDFVENILYKLEAIDNQYYAQYTIRLKTKSS